jgi:hypothetical protein
MGVVERRNLRLMEVEFPDNGAIVGDAMGK